MALVAAAVKERAKRAAVVFSALVAHYVAHTPILDAHTAHPPLMLFFLFAPLARFLDLPTPVLSLLPSHIRA